jgi:preprotein translocase subunit SecY
MALTQRTPHSMPAFMRRLAVTLGVLAVYRLGTYLPIAGIDQAALANLYRGSGSTLAIERVSVFALGVSPIISILLLVEVARLALNRFNDWAGATSTNARHLDHYVLIGSLMLATWQAYGIAIALEQQHLVDEPGLQFRLVVVATFVAGTALLVWLAALISRYGLGSGVWILLLAPHLAGLPSFAAGVMEAVRSGVLSPADLVAALVCGLITLVILAALARALVGSGMPLDRTLVWPLFIAVVPTSVLVFVPWLFPAGPIRDTAAAFLSPGAPLYLAALAVFVIVISLAQWARVEARPTAMAEPSSAPAGAVGASLGVLTALTLAAVTVVPELLKTQFNIAVLINGTLITVTVAIAVAMQDLLRRQT